jgi:uncharacterized BrkB/YihY/UPF0761 family membrane protein
MSYPKSSAGGNLSTAAMGHCHTLTVYLGRSSFNSAYGAAGSLVVLLLWIYYSAQIFLLGAEFTRVFAYRHGSRSGASQRVGGTLKPLT